MTRTVEEIVRYCQEENTFGALLLCGEWGSGKTHVVEYDLPERLGHTGFAFLRVSLFGADSVEGVRRRIRAEVLQTILANLPESVSEHSANRWITRIGDGSAASAIYASDPVSYILPEPCLGNKRLVLIFDDLERSDLSFTEVLGLINEYCENLHIKTIVVANEEKIFTHPAPNGGRAEKNTPEAVYLEMKEKLISRTVRLKADEPRIIRSVLSQYRSSQGAYLAFLKSSEEVLIALLEDSELKNIRSFRCGIQDFERVYRWLREESLPEEEMRESLTSFVLFTILAKGGRISKSNLYGYSLNRLEQKYRGHYWDQTMPDCLKDAVLTGDWREDEIRQYIRKRKELLDGNQKAENRLRSLPLSDLDDATVASGWESYLKGMYDGQITPDEWILFLENQLAAREVGYDWPTKPDPSRLRAGVEITLEAVSREEIQPAPLAKHLNDAQLQNATSAERELYRRITGFMDGREYLCGRDRNSLLAALKSRDSREWFRCRRCQLKCFDTELAEVAMACYRELSGSRERQTFSDLMMRILSACALHAAFADEETGENLKRWIQVLSEQENTVKKNSLDRISIHSFRLQLETLLRKWDS